MAQSHDTIERLARIGRRVTGPRRAVVDAMAGLAGPFTIEELTSAAPLVGRATVFRTMKLLQEADVVCRMVREDGSVRYEVSTGDHHHHRICNACGRIDEFSDSDLDARIRRNAAEAGFTLAGHSLELYGRCSACAATAARRL